MAGHATRSFSKRVPVPFDILSKNFIKSNISLFFGGGGARVGRDLRAAVKLKAFERFSFFNFFDNKAHLDFCLPLEGEK